MSERLSTHECVTDLLPVHLSGKWDDQIVMSLLDGPRRFGELLTALQPVTPKVLAASLRAMQRDGFVTRTAYDEVPARVEYELTELGRSLLDLLKARCAWTKEHLADLRAARAASDQLALESA
ncbi:winged helix-turn-helix transcriptional regulator [Luteipulveratus mongoliensis]|uniref:HTH hxlR-type domain-containing protein n=1 Tax=Luteipulveratus mongoliensis TaxID=571913 RepID=A0A0K1JJ99_9MICO|nr:helix-turn-helix domain-containing protein [Luteipulveratus mongoliensis]AKU16665.1 hypothetical protein VV02_13635 [Luteipulveratus mongoliensis]